MNFLLRCNACKAECWAAGVEDPDTNAVEIKETDSLEDACDHLKDGGDYTIIDQEYEDDFTEC